MQKPKMKKEVAVGTVLASQRIIYFYATADALTEIETFGDVLSYAGNRQKQLHVDARFDFDEVVAWIEAYGTK